MMSHQINRKPYRIRCAAPNPGLLGDNKGPKEPPADAVPSLAGPGSLFLDALPGFRQGHFNRLQADMPDIALDF